ncbi:MAG: hypothetical protein HY049_14800 [Acidobacteria bacterium]|nr:hypothetical protein [Acidobacteriota bacterium]
MTLLLAATAVVGALGPLVLTAAGARVRSRARLPVPPALKLPIDFLIGAWGLAVLALAAGLAGWFSAPVLAAIAGLLALGGKWRGNGWRFREPLAVAVPSVVLIPVALAPPFFYDALVYHLGLPWQALREGRIAPHPESVFAAFPPLAQLVGAPSLALHLTGVPALLHLASTLAAGAIAASLARRLGAPRATAWLAGSGLALLPAVALVPGLPAAEGWLLAPVLAAVAMVIWRKEFGPRAARTAAILAGLLCGAACAARLQGIAWSAIVLVLLAARVRKMRPIALAAAAWICGSAPWWLKNLVLLGDPLAPIGWRREGMETLWRDAQSFTGVTAVLTALAPHAAYAAPLALAAILAVFAPGDRRPAWLCLLAAAGATAWGATGVLARFLEPTLAILLVAAASAGRTRAGRWIGGAALAVSLALGLAATAREMSRWGGVAMAFEESGSDVGGAVTNNPAAAFAEAVRLPPASRVLFIGEARGFGFPRPFVAPSQHDVSPLREPIETLPDAVATRAWLKGQGFTHLLINYAELGRLSRSYPVAPWRTEEGRRRFQALVDLLGPPVVQSGEVAIFAL